MIIVATMSLPAVDHPNADRWNADRSCQFLPRNPFMENSHNIIEEYECNVFSKYLAFK